MHDVVARHRPFQAGDEVVLRSVQTFGPRGPAVGFAVAGRVLVDDADVAVVASPLGSAVRVRAGVGSGPNSRLVLPEDWDGSYLDGRWFGAPVVRVHPKGREWSVWRWHDGTRWLPDWYINLERPWERTSIGFDSQDWTLDVVANRDSDGGWVVRYKDEDEVAFYAGVGLISEEDRVMIERAGEEACAAVHAGAFPFTADWSSWTPQSTWLPPSMPVGWAAVS